MHQCQLASLLVSGPSPVLLCGAAPHSALRAQTVPQTAGTVTRSGARVPWYHGLEGPRVLEYYRYTGSTTHCPSANRTPPRVLFISQGSIIIPRARPRQLLGDVREM